MQKAESELFIQLLAFVPSMVVPLSNDNIDTIEDNKSLTTIDRGDDALLLTLLRELVLLCDEVCVDDCLFRSF
jgi:hypothetical protein